MMIRFGMLIALIATGVWMGIGDTLGVDGRPLTVTGGRVAAPMSLMVAYVLLVMRSEGPWFLVWVLNKLEDTQAITAMNPIGFTARTWVCRQINEAIEMDEARRVRKI